MVKMQPTLTVFELNTLQKKFTRNKNNIKNIYKIQACGSIICGDIYIGFIKFMLKGKTLLDY